MKADYAIIGGSSTHSINFPEDVADVKVLAEQILDTPYGESPSFKLFEYSNKKVLTCKMHGWRKGVSRADASLQVFWVLQQAGVKHILGEGGVGALSKRYETRDLIVPDDFIDLSCRRSLVVDGSHLLIMREPFCSNLREALIESASKNRKHKVFDKGVYVCTDGNRFETKAEVNMLKNWADIIGQSTAPEAALARDIGACYASIQMVVNYAEGVVDEWDYEEFKDIFYTESKEIGEILLNALESIEGKCQCRNLRKPSLLK